MLEIKLEKYAANKSLNLRNEILEECMPLIQTVARQTRNLYANQMTFDDVVSNCVIGMIDCIDSFDISKGLSFEAYAYSKLRHKLIDILRANDFLPRRVRKEAKEVQKAYHQLSNELMREPTDIELAKYMNVEVTYLSKHYQEFSSSQMANVEEMVYLSSEEEDPSQILFNKEQKNELIKALKNLSEKEQILISLYYYENLKLKEIGEIFEVSEARVCQMHSQAISKLKKMLKEESHV